MLAEAVRPEAHADPDGDAGPVPRPAGHRVPVSDVPREERGGLHEVHPIDLVAHVVEHARPAKQHALDGVAVVGHERVRAGVGSGHKDGLEEEERGRAVGGAVGGEEFGRGDDGEEGVHVFEVGGDEGVADVLRREGGDFDGEVLG